MSTRSSSRSLLPPLEDPERCIRNRQRKVGDPSLLLDFEEINMANNNNNNNVQGPPPAGPNIPAPDLRSMEELLLPMVLGMQSLYPRAAWTWLEKEPPNSITTWNDLIDTFYNGLSQSDQDSLNSAAGGNLLTRNTQEALIIIENKSKVEALGKQISLMNKPIHSIQDSCDSCGGPHSSYECQAINNMSQEEVYAYSGLSRRDLRVRFLATPFLTLGERSKKLPHEVVLPESTTRVPPLVVQPSPSSRSSEIPLSPSSSPSELPKRNPHQPLIPYPSRLNKEKLQDKSDIQVHKFLQMFKKLHFNISLAEALALMPKYDKMLKDLLSDKEKLLGLANTSLTENCSAVLLKKLPEKLRDPGKFLIPCSFPELEKRMALADLAGIAEDFCVQVGKFTFPADFVVVDYDVDPRVPLILGRPFLRKTHALLDVYGEELILRDDDEKLIFHKSNHPFSGSTTSPSDSFPSLTPFKTSDSLLEEFIDELALLDLFPPGNEDDNFDPEADLREIEYFLNRDPSIDSSPKTDIDIIDPILDSPIIKNGKSFCMVTFLITLTQKMKKDKDLKMECLIDDMDDDFFPLLPTSDSTLLEESSEIATLLSSPFGNEDKVFNPGILLFGGTKIFNDESKDKDLKVNTSSEVLLILEERNFLSISSDQELLFHLELSVAETLLSFSSESVDKVFNPRIPISNGVHSFTLGLSHRTYETFKIVNVHLNIFNEGPMKIFPLFCFCPKDKGIRGEIPYDREDHRACFQSSNHSVSDHLHLEKCMALADLGANINLMPLSVWKKLMLHELIPTRMTLELANRFVAYPAGIAEDVCIQVAYLRDDNEKLIFHAYSTSKHPHKHGNESINMINFIDITCEDHFQEVLKIQKSNHSFSGSTTSPSDSFPSLTPFKSSDSLLEEFADELALLDPFPPGNKDDNFDPKDDLREIEYLLNRDPSTNYSPKTDIDIIDPILDRFTDEPALVYSFPSGDDDDDLFDLKSDNEEWKKLLYGDLFDNTHSKNEKDKDLKMECLIDDMDDVFFPLLPTSDSILLEESSEIATLLSFPFENEDKVFNPGILLLGGTQIFNDESKDKDLKVNTSYEALLILKERNFLSISFDQELLFHLELSVTETLLSFSSENEDKVFNPGIPIANRVHSFTLGLSHRTYETFKIVNVHSNILNEGFPMIVKTTVLVFNPLISRSPIIFMILSFDSLRRAFLLIKPLEFQAGDKVMLKVSPWKGVIRFGKWGKLNPRYIGPFKILAIPLDEIQIDDKLNFIEEPVEIMDREVKRLKKSRILILKVHWNSRRGPEFTWEREDQMKKKYPQLFANPA
ncbi:reverse transcriptase domain-containing protein [Tanacetum coccineum]